MIILHRRSNIEPIIETIALTPENIDHLSEKIRTFLDSLRMERANKIRVLFSLEEAVLRWMDHFGSFEKLHVEMATAWGRPVITLTISGEQYNPLVSSENDLGDWAENLYTGISMSPIFTYRRGLNVLQLKLPKQTVNPALKLISSVAIGVFFGGAGKLLLPPEIRTSIVQSVLDPVEQLFLHILNASSGPVIFLSVVTAICGLGMLPSIGKSGQKVVSRMLILTFSASVITAAAAFFGLGLHMVGSTVPGKQFLELQNYFLSMVPNDILSPFIEGNSPQLIGIAIIIGNALVINSSQTPTLRNIVEQADSIALTVAGWVSTLTPFFVTMLLILGIWNESVSVIIGLWKPILIFAVLNVIILGIRMVTISKENQVSVRLLAQKMKETFRAAFINASVDAAYGDCQVCCDKRLGISTKLTDYALPVGMVIYMPSGCISAMVGLLYAAKAYDVPITLSWIIIGIVLTTALVVATPPVAGIGLLNYAAIFTQLGIPHQALTMAMVADIILGFAVSAVNLTLLQMELVREAKKLGLLDVKMLRAELKSR